MPARQAVPGLMPTSGNDLYTDPVEDTGEVVTPKYGCMPDTPVERSPSGPYDPGLPHRVARLEQDVGEIRDSVEQLTQAVTRVETLLLATLPHLATKADLTALESRLEARIGESEARSDAKITALADRTDARLAVLADRTDARFAALETRLAGFESKTELRFTTLERRIEARFAAFESKTDARFAVSDSKAEERFATLEATAAELKFNLARLEAKIDVRLAEMPSRTYMWGILGVLLTAYAAGLAALAIVK